MSPSADSAIPPKLDRPDPALFGPKGAVRASEKLLLVCSINSLSSENWSWVDREVSEALAEEREHLKSTGESVNVIVPLDLDGFLFSEDCTYHRRQDLRDRVAARYHAKEGDSDPFEGETRRLLQALRSERPPGIFDWGAD